MADINNSNKTDAKQKAEDDLLVSLADIYAFVKSQELVATLATYTFDDYILEAKNKIKSDDTTARPTLLVRLDKLEENTKNAISKAKQLNKDK